MDVSVWFMYLARRSTAVKFISHGHQHQEAVNYVMAPLGLECQCVVHVLRPPLNRR